MTGVLLRALTIGWWTTLLTHGQVVRFAVIGDYGVDDANELAVASLLKTNLRPDFIVTVGDNQYDGAANIDHDIGKYFQEYIGNYRGTYGAGASSNRFFPALGNHDYRAKPYRLLFKAGVTLDDVLPVDIPLIGGIGVKVKERKEYEQFNLRADEALALEGVKERPAISGVVRRRLEPHARDDHRDA